jgi:putative holliday junction resolvase
MGLDIGDSRIGIALSDPMGIIATPLVIINRSDELAAINKIVDIIKDKKVVTIIAGLPLNMDGSRGSQAEKTASFVAELSCHTDIPVEYRDERLSTVSAREIIQGMRKTNRKTRYDAAAAALILQSYLDEASRRTDQLEDPDTPAE